MMLWHGTVWTEVKVWSKPCQILWQLGVAECQPHSASARLPKKQTSDDCEKTCFLKRTKPPRWLLHCLSSSASSICTRDTTEWSVLRKRDHSSRHQQATSGTT